MATLFLHHRLVMVIWGVIVRRRLDQWKLIGVMLLIWTVVTMNNIHVALLMIFILFLRCGYNGYIISEPSLGVIVLPDCLCTMLRMLSVIWGMILFEEIESTETYPVMLLIWRNSWTVTYMASCKRQLGGGWSFLPKKCRFWRNYQTHTAKCHLKGSPAIAVLYFPRVLRNFSESASERGREIEHSLRP